MPTLNTMFATVSTARLNDLLKTHAMHDTMERLYRAMLVLDAGEGPTAAARFLGLPNSQTAKNWEDRGMSSDGLLAAESKGISSVWLKTGKGAMLRLLDDFRFVSRADVRFANGVSSVVFHDETKPPLAFRHDFLRKLGVGEGNAVVISAHGPSNLPTIPEEAVVLLDKSDNTRLDGDFFGFRIGNDLLIKRLTSLNGVGILAVAENPEFKPKQTVYKPPEDDFEVIGRAKWMGAEI